MPRQSEIFEGYLYSYLKYPQAGTNEMLFFQHSMGDEIDGEFQTGAHTNMTHKGYLPKGVEFLAQKIIVTVTANVSFADEVKANRDILSCGELRFHLLSKTYLQEALTQFRSTYEIAHPITIQSLCNFAVLIRWPNKVPIDFEARIGVRLRGFITRPTY